MKVNMKKIFRKSIVFGAVIALAVMGVMCFLSQELYLKDSMKSTAQARLSDAVDKMYECEEEIKQLTNDLNGEYLIKTRIFSHIISLNPKILNDEKKLEEIKEKLGVDELHVSDDKGIIRWGTVKEYFGFDFASTDQGKPFMEILSNNKFELAQDPQPNGSEGKLFQYIGVSRLDKPGIVQIGMEPERLANALKANQPNKVLENINVGKNGFVFAINSEDNTLAAYKDESLIGKDANEVGIESSALKTKKNSITRTKIGKESYYICTEIYGDYILGTLVPTSEVMNQALAMTAVIVFMTLIIVLIFALIINWTVNNNIISPMSEIEKDMREIKAGNTEIRLNTRSCIEFNSLSDGVNDMLSAIDDQIIETKRLNDSMRSLLNEVYKTSNSINSHSAAMHDISSRSSNASALQVSIVGELKNSFETITNGVLENAKSAESASSFSKDAAEKLRRSTNSMEKMISAMENITALSDQIEKIVKTIDDIAFQTNILALNAAVEAARAGANGKGFAVVADEVRNLANKSAEAAKNTTKLISETISAVQSGNEIANTASADLQSTINGIEQSVELIAEISKASAEQTERVTSAASGMSRISDTALNNSEIAQSASETAEKLDKEAATLISLISSHNKRS